MVVEGCQGQLRGGRGWVPLDPSRWRIGRGLAPDRAKHFNRYQCVDQGLS